MNPNENETAHDQPVAAAATGSEPDWKTIAWKLMRQCEFALTKLKADGWTGELMDMSGPEIKTRHWKEDMADTMELVPGVKVDREAMHACSLPKRQRDKFFADRKAAKEAQNASVVATAAPDAQPD